MTLVAEGGGGGEEMWRGVVGERRCGGRRTPGALRHPDRRRWGHPDGGPSPASGRRRARDPCAARAARRADRCAGPPTPGHPRAAARESHARRHGGHRDDGLAHLVPPLAPAGSPRVEAPPGTRPTPGHRAQHAVGSPWRGTCCGACTQLLIGSFWLGAPALVNGPIAIATIVIVGRGSRASVAVTPGAPTAARRLAPTARGSSRPDRPAPAGSAHRRRRRGARKTA